MDQDKWKFPSKRQIKQYAEKLVQIFPEELSIDSVWSSFYYWTIFYRFLEDKKLALNHHSKHQFFYRPIINYFKQKNHPKFSKLTLKIVNFDENQEPPLVGMIIFAPQTRKFLIVEDIRTSCFGFVKTGMRYKESITQATKRCLVDEINQRLSLDQGRKFSFYYEKQRRECTFYVCEVSERMIEINLKKFIDYKWVEQQDIFSPNISGLKFNHITLEAYSHFRKNEKKYCEKGYEEKNMKKKKYVEKQIEKKREKQITVQAQFKNNKIKYVEKQVEKKTEKGKKEKEKTVYVQKKTEREIMQAKEKIFYRPETFESKLKNCRKKIYSEKDGKKSSNRTRETISSTSFVQAKEQKVSNTGFIEDW